MTDHVKIEIELSRETVKWLGALIEARPEASHIPDSLKGLVEQIATHFAEGIKRPGSWEREMVSIMGYDEALTGYEKTLPGYENT
ncbi:MAG: hypothetical protein ACYCZR_05365 [Burkholderiales bacterium]